LKEVYAEQVDEGRILVIVKYRLPEVSTDCDINYRVMGNGDIIVKMIFTPSSNDLPDIPRMGMRMQIPGSFSKVKWYGRGPRENYIDRNTAAFVGLYEKNVEELYFAYPSPQENGNRTDTRWIALRDEEERGLLVTGMPLLSWSALNYTQEDLSQDARATKHPFDLQQQDFISLNIDDKQMGVGGDNSWGAWPHDKYRIAPGKYIYSYRLSPLTEDMDPMEQSKIFYE